jgi:hypothetical protein
MGKPKKANQFLFAETNGVSVYYSRIIASNNEEINLVLSKYIGIKYLEAKNVYVD